MTLCTFRYENEVVYILMENGNKNYEEVPGRKSRTYAGKDVKKGRREELCGLRMVKTKCC